MPNFDRDLHSYVCLTVSLLYLLGCIGFDKTAIEAGLALSYYLLYRF